MGTQRSLFKELDETQKWSMKLSDNKELRVEGQGTIALKTLQGEVKLLHNEQFVRSLAYNLLSVGQLSSSGYSITFDSAACSIVDKKIGRQIASIYKIGNTMFRLKLSDIECYNLTVKNEENPKLWH